MSKQIEVLSAVHGIAPRSEELFKLGAGLERGRNSLDSFQDQLAQETDDWLRLQAEAGIDIAGDGKLSWQDHLRPIVKASDGFIGNVDNAPVTRWFEDNRFYRRPTATSALKFNPEVFEETVGSPAEAFSLLAPYSFRELSDWSEDLSEAEIDSLILGLYSGVFKHLSDNGVRRVILEEYEQQESLGDQLLSHRTGAWATLLANQSPDLDVTYLNIGETGQSIPLNQPPNFSFGVRTGTLNHLSQIRPYGPSLAGREIWQQVIDSNTTLLDGLNVSDWSIEALRCTRPGRIVLTNTVDFELLPLSVAQEKVKRLADFAGELQEHLDREL